MAVIPLSAGNVSARISTFGGAILRLDHGTVPLLRPAPDAAAPIDSACYPLVPFGNRVRGNQFAFGGQDYTLQPNTDWDSHYLHGEGWRSDWAVTAQTESTVTLHHNHAGEALPYHYDAEQQINLRPDGADQANGIVDLGRVEAREHFVQQQKLGTGGQRPRQLEKFALVQVQFGGERLLLTGKPGEADPVQRLGADFGLAA